MSIASGESRTVSVDDSPRPLSISVVIPSARRPGQLRDCLQSVAAQTGINLREVVVVADRDPMVADVVAEFGPSFRSLAGAGTPAGLRNLGLGGLTGDLVLFLDDDATLPAGFLDRLARLAETYPDAGVFGGPNTTPTSSPPFEVTQGAVLSSVLGGGPVRRRYGPRKVSWADERVFTLCNLTVRRSVLRSFDETLLCAEENEMLRELSAAGVPMLYDPELSAEHRRRPTWRSFAWQMHKYGRGRGQLLRRGTSGLVLAPLATAVMLAYLLVLPALLAGVGPLAAAPAALYVGAVVAQAARIGGTLRSVTAGVRAVGLCIVVHVAYGAGVWRAVLSTSTRDTTRPRPGAQLATLVRRQIALRSTRTVVGIAWPLLLPLGVLALYARVFQHVFLVRQPRYAVFVFAGLLPWTFLTQTLGTAVTSLSSERDLLRRRAFNVLLLPVATTLTMFTYFVVTLAVFLGVLSTQGRLDPAELPALVVLTGSLLALVASLAVSLALVDVWNRDLRHVLGNLLTVWFFLVPVLYRGAASGPVLRRVQQIDPASRLVSSFREVLYLERVPPTTSLATTVGLCAIVALLVAGVAHRVGPRVPFAA